MLPALSLVALLAAPAAPVQAEPGPETGDDYFIPRRRPAEGQEGLYSKPFLYAREGVARVGGYVDLELRNEEGKNTSYRAHRLVPFIYASVSDRVSFATEIELEDAGEDAEGGLIETEFAFIDYNLTDHLTGRAGVILTPLGRLNLLHDSPLLDSTDRPLMHTRIVPSTLRESGMGLLGSWVRTGGDLRLGWEAYATQGFKGGAQTAPAISAANGFRNARPHKKVNNVKAYTDNNSNMAAVGRVTASPFVGLEGGLSWHVGSWDDQNENDYGAYGLDLHWASGRWELDLEGVAVGLDTTATAKAAGVPDRMLGGYAQVEHHLYWSALRHVGGDEDAHLTPFVRLGREVIDNPASVADNERERVTVGLSFRPNASHTVFKFERQLNDESGALADVDDDAWLWSVATYF
ncbi:MAG: hypothetical protein HY722_10620 [Planctomycetes bacterium]|nr:hypothetical protein [Planctomycetota bacterium]